MHGNPRWTMVNALPVLFMLCIIGTIWSLYSFLHLLPLLQLRYPKAAVDADKHRCGIIEVAVSQSLMVMLVICLGKTIFADPGSVPREPPWLPEEAETVDIDAQAKSPSITKSRNRLHEAKQTGERRFCKWCQTYKPDRCHHCRTCGRCVLKMDHYCPWVANCIGFRNHKYFFLLVFYAMLNCAFIVGTMSETCYKAAFEEMPFKRRFMIVFAMTLVVMMCVLLTAFFGFHVWLMCRGATTIEFCEKMSRQPSWWLYDCGVYTNVCNVLGPTPLLWLLPVSLPNEEGLWFNTHPAGIITDPFITPGDPKGKMSTKVKSISTDSPASAHIGTTPETDHDKSTPFHHVPEVTDATSTPDVWCN